MMARFFFDTSIGEAQMRDEEGLDYTDVAQARRDARRSLTALVAEAIAQEASHCAITVRDCGCNLVVRFYAHLGEDPGTA